MATTVDVKELPARFSEILAEAAAGNEVIVTEDDVPRARLLPVVSEHREQRRELMNRGFGIWKDRDDLPDFEALRAEWDRHPASE